MRHGIAFLCILVLFPLPLLAADSAQYDPSALPVTANAGGVPVGTILTWPVGTIPDGWLECDGQSTAAYPGLAAVVGPTVPDLRGEFVRGWDHGRGTTDAGRTLASTQGDAIRNITGAAGSKDDHMYSYVNGPYYLSQRISYDAVSGRGGGNGWVLGFDASRVVPTANENRPRNVAMMYIIRAQ